MKTKAIFFIFTIAVLFFYSQSAKSQDAVEGEYKVGKTSCTIEWHVNEFRVYWNGGTGYTVLSYIKDLPNGNIVYDEYENDWKTYTGTFTFKNERYLSGKYERADGKEFDVKRK